MGQYSGNRCRGGIETVKRYLHTNFAQEKDCTLCVDMHKIQVSWHAPRRVWHPVFYEFHTPKRGLRNVFERYSLEKGDDEVLQFLREIYRMLS